MVNEMLANKVAPALSELHESPQNRAQQYHNGTVLHGSPALAPERRLQDRYRSMGQMQAGRSRERAVTAISALCSPYNGSGEATSALPSATAPLEAYT